MKAHLLNPTVILLRLALLAALVVIPVQRVAAQATVAEGNDLFLSLVSSNGAAAPAGPYAQLLERVAQRCGVIGLNQICYVNGVVTLTATGSVGDFSTPGAVADLTDGASVSVMSEGAGIDSLSVAWLRLRANAARPDQGVTILVFGNVEIDQIELFASEADLDKEKTLLSLRFASSPIAGVDKLGSSGLVVTNPADEELLSIKLNGAAITLGLTALAEATPGGKMTVTMANGASRTEANGGESTAVQNPIYVRNNTDGGFTFDTTAYLILVHTPVK